jgi:hypothetical protein
MHRGRHLIGSYSCLTPSTEHDPSTHQKQLNGRSFRCAGVRVNAVAPGVIASSGLNNYDPAVQASIASNAAVSNYAGRLGTSAECSAPSVLTCFRIRVSFVLRVFKSVSLLCSLASNPYLFCAHLLRIRMPRDAPGPIVMTHPSTMVLHTVLVVNLCSIARAYTLGRSRIHAPSNVHNEPPPSRCHHFISMQPRSGLHYWRMRQHGRW